MMEREGGTQHGHGFDGMIEKIANKEGNVG